MERHRNAPGQAARDLRHVVPLWFAGLMEHRRHAM